MYLVHGLLLAIVVHEQVFSFVNIFLLTGHFKKQQVIANLFAAYRPKKLISSVKLGLLASSIIMAGLLSHAPNATGSWINLELPSDATNVLLPTSPVLSGLLCLLYTNL